MRAIIFVPARGGSTRVPGKNLATVGDRSLLHRAIDCALLPDCDAVVSTQDPEIAREAACLGAKVHARPAELADAFAQIEPSIAHWFDGLAECDKPDVIVLRQPTSPFVTSTHVREAIDLLVSSGADCVVGVKDVSMDHAFAGEIISAMHHHDTFYPTRRKYTRPRSQDVPKVWRESGALYAFTRKHWEATEKRMWGAFTAPYRMSESDSMDIDTPEDLAICRAIAVATGR